MKVVALAGGVGGAKLAEGLSQCLDPNDLTIIVNVGDDFEHLGLRICPDIDTVCYTLAGLVNQETGWGHKEDTWNCLDSLAELGAQTWFRLGDRDLATHIERTTRLKQGQTLSQITRDFCRFWGIKSMVLPVSDDPVPTWVRTDDGFFAFQEYFVRQQCQPRVMDFEFRNIEIARPAPHVIESIEQASLVVICPSNPWVSIDPILAITGIKDAISSRLVIALSPLIAGRAIKGPAAKMFLELGVNPSVVAVAEHYRRFLSGFIIDELDANFAEEIKEMGIEVLVTNTIMHTAVDRKQLADATLRFGRGMIGK